MLGLLLLAPMGAAALEAPRLIASDPLVVSVGQTVRWSIDADGANHVRLANAPQGARVLEDQGQWVLDWVVPATLMPGERVLILRGSNASGALAARRVRVNVMPSEAKTPEAKTPEATAEAPLPTPSHSLPSGKPTRLPSIPLQSLLLDQPWQLWIRPLNEDGGVALPVLGRDELRALDLPAGMVVKSAPQGWHLAWTPTEAGRFEIRLQLEQDRGASLAEQTLKLNVLGPADKVPRQAPDNTSGSADPPPQPTGPPAALAIAPLSNQVVSVGRVITVDVQIEQEEPVPVMLHVDRLPRGAQFYANNHGGRTFRWATRNRDQGQHLFRFTAVDPADPRRRTSRDLTIIIGDPAVIRTVPDGDPTPTG